MGYVGLKLPKRKLLDILAREDKKALYEFVADIVMRL